VPLGTDLARLPIVPRAYLAARQGRWQEAVRWLDEELAQLPAGPQRDRVATLRAHLLMEEAPRVEGALALASLLADASVAMAKGRFAAASAPDPYHQPEDRALFVGPFVVAAPDSGWVHGGSPLSRMMVGHAQDIRGREAPHLRTQDAYLASLAPYVGAAIAQVPEDDALSREVLEATRAFIELNERIRREGGERVRTRTTAPLEEATVSFLRTYGASGDARVQAFGRFLFRAYPGWAGHALSVRPDGR
jgi:hypothetical protein